MYLQALAGHDNLIRLQHVVKAENGRDIYLTFDHMGEKTKGTGIKIVARGAYNACTRDIRCSGGTLLVGALYTACTVSPCNNNNIIIILN